jgi:hypothetical protein
MKPGTYTVRGTVGPDKSEPVQVDVYQTMLRGIVARFVFRGIDCHFAPRPFSPHPERVSPAKLQLDLQPTARSIAKAALDAAKAAGAEDARQADIARREAEQEAASVEDIVLGGIVRRSMGVSE